MYVYDHMYVYEYEDESNCFEMQKRLKSDRQLCARPI